MSVFGATDRNGRPTWRLRSADRRSPSDGAQRCVQDPSQPRLAVRREPRKLAVAAIHCGFLHFRMHGVPLVAAAGAPIASTPQGGIHSRSKRLPGRANGLVCPWQHTRPAPGAFGPDRDNLATRLSAAQVNLASCRRGGKGRGANGFRRRCQAGGVRPSAENVNGRPTAPPDRPFCRENTALAGTYPQDAPYCAPSDVARRRPKWPAASEYSSYWHAACNTHSHGWPPVREPAAGTETCRYNTMIRSGGELCGPHAGNRLYWETSGPK